MQRFLTLTTYLVSVVLSLLGADVGQRTLDHRQRADGAEVVHSQATILAGVARYACLASASGACHYTLVQARCAGATEASSAVATPARSDGCPRRAVERFVVAQGQQVRRPALPGREVCVSASPQPLGAGCRPLDLVATQ